MYSKTSIGVESMCEEPTVEREFKWLTSENEPENDDNSDWTL